MSGPRRVVRNLVWLVLWVGGFLLGAYAAADPALRVPFRSDPLPGS